MNTINTELSDYPLSPVLKDIGRNLAFYRMNAKLSTSTVAEAIGVSEKQLLLIESGETDYSVYTLQDLTKLYHVDLLAAFDHPSHT